VDAALSWEILDGQALEEELVLMVVFDDDGSRDPLALVPAECNLVHEFSYYYLSQAWDYLFQVSWLSNDSFVPIVCCNPNVTKNMSSVMF